MLSIEGDKIDCWKFVKATQYTIHMKNILNDKVSKSKKSRTSQFMHRIEVNYLTDTMLTLLLIYPSPEFRE